MRFLGLGLRSEWTSAFLNFKSLFCSLFFGEHEGEVQCSDGFCEAWPVLCLFQPAFSESEEKELQDAGLPGNWWQRSNQSFTFFLTVCLCLGLCVFQSLSFPGNIFYIQIIVLSNWRFFVWHPHGLRWLRFFYCSTSCLCFNLRLLGWVIPSEQLPPHNLESVSCKRNKAE